MRRRDFIRGIAGAAAAWPAAVRAQQPAIPVIGFLSSGTPTAWASFVVGFRQGLNETGFIDGQNVKIEYCWAEGHYDRLPGLAADLVSRRVAVIVASGGSDPAKAAKAATSKIPVIFISAADPVATGLVPSLNRPGANVTGVSLIGSALEAKRLELLHELVPKASTIAVFINPNYPDAKSQSQEVQDAAVRLGVKPIMFTLSTESDIDTALAALVQQDANALIITQDPFLNGQRERLIAWAARQSVPVIYSLREAIVAGGLISYGTHFPDGFRQAGIYVGKILKGIKPADLPVMQPTRFELVINLKTAKALGLQVPDKLLALADEVIE